MHKADRPDNEGRVVSAPPIECLLYGTASCMSCRTAPTPLNGSQRTTNLKASRLTTVLENLLDQPWAAFIWGAPGIGKSSIVRQIAERRRMPLIDIRASLLDPTDLRGIPMIQDGTAVWCPPSFLPKKSDKPGILFLDEINAAPPLVQAALYQLILDRRVGEYELPEGWRIIAAGNRREDKAVTFRLSSALANRFIHLNLEVDPDDWHAWATNRGIVGTGPAVEFLTFAKKAVLRKEIDAIIADPAGATIPTELDRLWVLVSFLVAGAQNDGILKIVPTLLPRLPVEFSIVLLRDLIRCRPQIVQEKGVSDFLKTNKVMLF